MAKGYWIASVDITDSASYERYVEANARAFSKFGARFLVRGGYFETMEGRSRARNIVLEFKDYPTALACYHSPEYQAAKALRDSCSEVDLIIVEGYDDQDFSAPDEE